MTEPRKRGRPRGIKSKAVNICLTADLDAFAIALGGGKRSKGIAIALQSAKATLDGINGINVTSPDPSDQELLAENDSTTEMPK